MLRIAFYNGPYDRKYLPGSVLTGCVVTGNRTPMSARFVKVEWEGRSSTCWSGASDAFAPCVFFKGEKLVWQQDVGTTKIFAGVQHFRFSFRLPDECPPSFNGKFGSIEYTIKGTINRPILPNLHFERKFTVTKPFANPDANLMTRCWSTSTDRVDAKKANEVEITLSLPKRVYYPGDVLVPQVSIKNNFELTPVTRVDLYLHQLSHYHTSPQERPCRSVYPVDCPLRAENQEFSWEIVEQRGVEMKVQPQERKTEEFHINLPLDVVPSFEHPLITVEYAVKAVVDGGESSEPVYCSLGFQVINPEDEPRRAEPLADFRSERNFANFFVMD
ncbi:unnamed protein product [Caenorhabditis sp. 36 PRJEB53466]|nr:unnamed protein product [Caenorhabditis sp. 36 PRJEB53466]